MLPEADNISNIVDEVTEEELNGAITDNMSSLMAVVGDTVSKRRNHTDRRLG